MKHRSFSSQTLVCGFSYIFLVQTLSPPLTAQADPLAFLVVDAVQGNGVKHRIGHPVPIPLGVRVRDEATRPVAGAEVIFELPEDPAEPGGSFAGGQRTFKAVSDRTGAAAVLGVRGNTIPGDFKIQVRASYKDSQGALRTGRATFLQTNVLEIKALALKVIQGTGRNDVKSGRAVEPKVVVMDDSGEGVAGAGVVFVLPAAGPSGVFEGAGKTRRTTSGEDGTATAAGLRAQKPCGRLAIGVTASLAGLQAEKAEIVQENKGCFPTGPVVGLLVGGGGGGGVLAWLLTRNGKSGNGPTSQVISITPGTPVFTGPGR